MTINYEIDEASQTLVVRGVGEVDEAQITAAFGAVLAEPAHRPGMKLLIDLTQQKTVTETEVLRSTAKRLEDPGLSFRRIAIVGDRDGMFAIARMMQAFADGSSSDIQVFRGQDEAVGWLAHDA